MLVRSRFQSIEPFWIEGRSSLRASTSQRLIQVAMNSFVFLSESAVRMVPPAGQCYGTSHSWCPEPELNRHGPFRILGILSPVCLPNSTTRARSADYHNC